MRFTDQFSRVGILIKSAAGPPHYRELIGPGKNFRPIIEIIAFEKTIAGHESKRQIRLNFMYCFFYELK